MKFAAFCNRLDKAIESLKSGRLLAALLSHRVLAGAEHRHILSSNIAAVVDIGANRGQFALATRRWAPNARIICLEPLPQAANTLRRIFLNDSKVTIHEVALGPSAQKVAMHVSARDDSSSLLPITSLQSDLFPGTEEACRTVVNVLPLADLLQEADLPSPAMLKLDVQGFELNALRGAESLLHCFEWVYCECSFVELYSGQALASDVIEWLSNRELKLTGVYNIAYDNSGLAIQADFLFTRSR